MQRILVAIDLSDHAPAVLDYARRMASAWQAHLLVLHVVHDLSYYTGVYITDIPLDRLQHRLETEAREQLEELCQEILEEHVTYEAIIVTGRPTAEIQRAIREYQVECLVIGAHRIDKPEHQLFGSTAERLLHQMSCPMMVIPPAYISDFVSHG